MGRPRNQRTAGGGVLLTQGLIPGIALLRFQRPKTALAFCGGIFLQAQYLFDR